MTDLCRTAIPAALLVVTTLAGCASTPQKSPLPLQKATRHIYSGIRADEDRSFRLAEAEFIDAYRLFSSVEDYPGMITALVNSSRAYRHEGALTKAATVMERALALVAHAPELSGEVWFEQGRILLSQGKAAEAALWSDKALNAASDSTRARLLNLSAEILFKQGNPGKSEAVAVEALSLARKHGDRTEEANGLRLIGEAWLVTDRIEAAGVQFQAALLIDKELAVSERIADDLQALSRVAEMQGKILLAAEFLQRTVDTKIAGRSRKGLEADLQRLVLLYERTGNSLMAEKVRAVIKTLSVGSPE